MPWSEWSDEKIVMYYSRSGEKAIIGELYRRYSILVFGTCMKYLKNRGAAQDACTEVFMKLIVKLKKSQPLSFKVWLYVVTRNYCLESLRISRRLPAIEFFEEKTQEKILDQEVEGKTKSDKDLWMGLLGKALKKLPEKQRQSIELFFFEGKKYREIALETGWTQKEVKSYIQNGKRNLKIFLSGQKTALELV